MKQPSNRHWIKKEIVKVRCHRGHTTFCLIDPATPIRQATLFPPWSCRAGHPTIAEPARCDAPLVIVSARGSAYRTLTVEADWFNVQAPRPEESAGHANAQRYQTKKDRFTKD